MIVELITVGTELLIGQRANSNATHIGSRLADEGFDNHFQVVVGDNLARLIDAVSTAMNRADAVILTGGIGPTQDDLTREAICGATGRAMERDEEHARWIAERVRAQGRSPSVSQLRMADLPAGAEGLANSTGAALGVALDHEGTLVFALPGVPAEMRPMLDNEVMPRLRARAGGPTVIRSRVIKVWGLGESAVADLLDELFESSNPSLAYLIRDMEVEVRITAKATDEKSATSLIAPVEARVRELLGDAVFAEDDETVESNVLARLAQHGWTVATVESATVGQVGARLAGAPGSEGFRGSVIPASAADGIQAPEADVALTIGEIGPDRAQGRRSTRPVPITVVTPAGEVRQVFHFGGDDEKVRAFATIAGLHMIRKALDA